MKKMSVILALLTIILILFIPDDNIAQSVSFPVFSKSSPEFFADACFYKGAGGQTQIEFAYSVKLFNLTFKDINDQNTAAITCNLIIKDSDNKTIFKQTREKAVIAKTQGEIKDESRGIIDMFVFDLLPGRYGFRVSLEDKFSNSVSTTSQTIEVPAFENAFSLSTPLFVLAVTTDLSQNIFIKGNQVILPNVSHEFILHKSVLQFYFEAYNLIAPTGGENNVLTASYLITDHNGDSLLCIPNIAISKPGTSLAKIEALDIRGFELGDYELLVTLQEPGANQRVSQKVPFRIIESAAPEMALPMSETDIQRYRDQMKYFATRQELKLYDQLDLRAKANFILEFWRARDNVPETPENEFMLECFSRMNYAEKNFKGDKGGLNSDMGRVLIIYGRPDDIEKNSMSLEAKPYEIWQYYSVNGGKHHFVFVDRNNSGIYTLVHSSVETEIQNPYWQQQELD